MSPQPQAHFPLKIRESSQICETQDLQKVKSSLKHLPEHFLFLFQYCCSSSLGVTSSLDQFYYPAPGGELPSLCSSIVFNFWSRNIHFSFLAQISGLLCCSYFSLGFACLGDFLSPSALQICSAAGTKHSRGCKDVPCTLRIKAVMQNWAALN